MLVEALGSEEVLPQAPLCCDVCTKENVPILLELIRPPPSVRKHAKSHTVHRVSEATKKTVMDHLLQEQRNTHFGYKMLGK